MIKLLHGTFTETSRDVTKFFEALKRLGLWEPHGWSHLGHDSFFGQFSLARFSLWSRVAVLVTFCSLDLSRGAGWSHFALAFLSLELGRCLVAFSERLVIPFGAASSLSHVSPFFDYVVMFLSLEIGCSLVMFCSLYCWVTVIYVELGSHLVTFCSRTV